MNTVYTWDFSKDQTSLAGGQFSNHSLNIPLIAWLSNLEKTCSISQRFSKLSPTLLSLEGTIFTLKAQQGLTPAGTEMVPRGTPLMVAREH